MKSKVNYITKLGYKPELVRKLYINKKAEEGIPIIITVEVKINEVLLQYLPFRYQVIPAVLQKAMFVICLH